MAKRSKAKAKRAKTAKTKKAKTARKTTKSKKARKPTRTLRASASGTDPCAAKQQAVDDAQLVVDDLTNEVNDPDIPAAVRKKAEVQLHTANLKLGRAERALEQCRRENP